MVAKCLLLVGGLALGACRWDVDRAAFDDGGTDPVVDPPLGDDARPAGGPDGPVLTAVDGGSGVVVELREAAVIDTFIHESTGGANGGDPVLYLDGSPQDRVLVRFELGAIPPGSVVYRATLIVQVVDSNPDEPITLHALTSAWTEADATWSQRTATEAWATPGGDLGPALGASFTMDALGALPLDVTGVVQDWVDGSIPNHGVAFVLSGVSEAHILARESGDVDGPVLQVELE